MKVKKAKPKRPKRWTRWSRMEGGGCGSELYRAAYRRGMRWYRAFGDDRVRAGYLPRRDAFQFRRFTPLTGGRKS